MTGHKCIYTIIAHKGLPKNLPTGWQEKDTIDVDQDTTGQAG